MNRLLEILKEAHYYNLGVIMAYKANKITIEELIERIEANSRAVIENN